MVSRFNLLAMGKNCSRCENGSAYKHKLFSAVFAYAVGLGKMLTTSGNLMLRLETRNRFQCLCSIVLR